MEHLKQETTSGTQFNLDALYKICPSCFTEARDAKTGELRHVVDFQKLRALLDDDAVEDQPETYDFTWVGKNNARREAAAPIRKTLRPYPEESVDWDNTQNLYIEGDNLEVLKLLQNSYMGKVKMIYIDPPYNTGNDFVYHDDYKVSREEYEQEAGNLDEEGNRYRKNTETNGRFHSDWCSMIYARLMVARSLLTEDGVIFISMDDNEVENLTKICNEIFGEQNFITCIIWERSYAPINLKKHFSESHDYILCYTKNINNAICNGLPRPESTNAKYGNPDNDPRGLWRTDNLSVGPAITEKIYPITTPSGRVCLPPKGRCWLYTKERYEEMVADNRIWFGEDGNNVPAPKRFLSEVKQGLTPMTIWKYVEVGHNQDSMRELRELFDGEKVFDYSKPTKLIERMCQLYSSEECLILDFFSGSATTAHAVMQLNAKDGGNRKFIMVQLPEQTDEKSEAYKAGYKNICEIGKERIRRAGKKIKEEAGLQAQNLDIGFRVFKCDSSNMKDVYYTPAAYNQDMLWGMLDNIKEDRTDLDLLFGCMLEWGVELSLPLSKETIDGCDIHIVNNGDLVACFSSNITENVVNAIAEKMPLRVVFRDSSFDEAAHKMNLFERFKQICGWSEEEIKKNIKVI